MLQMVVHQKNFYGKVNPKYAIISSGKNDDDHPGLETLERVKNIGIKTENKNLYITEELGTIWLQSNGENITIETTWDINLDSVDNKKKKISFIKNFIMCVDKKEKYLFELA